MTGRIIRLKKCSLFTGIYSVSWLFVAACWAMADVAVAVTLPKLPVIQNVGVVPLQWEGESKGLSDVKQQLADDFPKTVREARRFRVLGDDLVASLWKDATGREELRNEFELTGFIGLTVSSRGDMIQLTTRLMDSWMKTNLLETDTVSRGWLTSANDGAIAERLQRLVFRLFNRLPVDVSVTSVQGSYITLSGGAEQGIEAGDKVDLVRATVKSLHPANGTWLDFNKRPLGHAQVIEVKNFTAVAKLLDQIQDNAVEVGDGAKIPAISSRVKFARLADNDGFKDAGDQGTIIVPPLYQGDQPKPVPTTNTTKSKTPPPSGMLDAPIEKAQDQAPAAKPSTQSDDPQGQADNGPSVWDQFTDDATSHRILDEVVAYAGPYWWKVRGPVNSAGKFPLYLLNSVGAGVTRTMFYKIKGAFGGGLLFGGTPHGNYVGYDTYGRMYWEDEFGGDPMLKYWRAGGVGRISGMSVSSGDFGGGDYLRIGFFGGLGGTLNIGADNGRYDWFADYTLMPLNIGRIGYGGKYKSVESSLGTELNLGAYMWEPVRTIQWGGGIDLGDERMTLKNGGRRPHFSEYSIKLLLKYAL